MTTDDEFRILEVEASARGLLAELPEVRRIDLEAPYPRAEPPAPRLPGESDQGRISLLAWGGAPARILLLHGAALNAHTWDATLLHWGVPALAVDLPGHGESSWRADGDYSAATNAAALGTLIDSLVEDGLLAPGFVLVGQSLGGLTSLYLANGREEVAHVVLVDVVPLPISAASVVETFLAGPSDFASREEVVQRALAFGLGGDEGSLRRAVTLNTRTRPDGRVEWKHHLARLGARALGLRDPREQWGVLAGVEAPFDLVVGDRGILSATELSRFAEVRPRGRVVTLEAGHNVQEDAPAELAATLARLTGVHRA
ncbi:MAG: alpha/beta fold hydrolase [Pauljensenia sp.]